MIAVKSLEVNVYMRQTCIFDFIFIICLQFYYSSYIVTYNQ